MDSLGFSFGICGQVAGIKRKAFAKMIALTRRSQAPKPFFRVLGFTLLVSEAPKRALKMAVAAIAPAARSDAKPS